MDPAAARRAISKDVTSLARAEAEKEVLLTTDRLAEWANDCLIFDDRLSGDGEAALRTNVGTLMGPGSDPTQNLLPNYRQWLKQREDKGPAFGQNNFKEKLVSLLRDNLNEPWNLLNPELTSPVLHGLRWGVPVEIDLTTGAFTVLEGPGQVPYTRQFGFGDGDLPPVEGVVYTAAGIHSAQHPHRLGHRLP